MDGQRRPEIIDTRQATPAFSAKDLSKLAAMGRDVFSTRPSMAPRAVVVNGIVHFGLARLFAALAAGWVSVSIFEEMALAEAWIAQFIQDA